MARFANAMDMRISDEAVFSEVRKAVLRAFLKWLGETVIGLIPLLARILFLMTSDAGAHHVGLLPLEEVNIVTVVICGLGLLSLFHLNPHGEEGSSRYFTPITYLIALMALLLLVGASLLYAVGVAGIANGNATLPTFAGLGIAALVTLYLAIEQAWLKAVDDATSGGLTGNPESLDVRLTKS